MTLGQRFVALPAECLLGICAIAPLVLMAVGWAIAQGLTCADDAYSACVARYLVEGYGYASPGEGGASSGGLVPFGPGASTGPTVILPVALGLLTLGISEHSAMLSAIAWWTILLAALAIGFKCYWKSASISCLLFGFSFLVLSLFGYHFEQWSTVLGEVHAALLVGLSLLILTARKMSGPRTLFAGFLFGLAVTAKLLALLAGFGLILAFVWSLMLETRPLQPRRAALLGTLLFAGVSIPTLVFEICKFVSLGPLGYSANWHDYILFVKEVGTPKLAQRLPDLLRTRLEILEARFSLSPLRFVTVAAMPIVIAFVTKEHRLRIFILANLAGCFALTVYWLFGSGGIARYMTIPLVLLVISIAAALAQVWNQRWIVAPIVALAAVSPGLSKIRYAIDRCDQGFFQSSSALHEFREAIAIIGTREPHVLATQWWATGIRFKFSLGPSLEIYRLDALHATDRTKILFVVDRGFVASDDSLVADAISPPRELLLYGKFFYVSVYR